MKTVTLNFAGFDFSVTETEKGFNINDLRLQVIDFIDNNPEVQKWTSAFKSTQNMAKWTRSVSDKAKEFYGFETVRGGSDRGATYVNENGLYAYAMWLNEDFGFAVIGAFKDLANGDVVSAVKKVRLVVRTAIRQDNVDYTNEFASKVGRQFGRSLLPQVMKTVQNHINRTLFGVETEELREMARQHTGSKARKIAHREFYDDSTIIRITALTTACITKFEELYGKALSPAELMDEMISFIDQFGKLYTSSKFPSYKEKA